MASSYLIQCIASQLICRSSNSSTSSTAAAAAVPSYGSSHSSSSLGAAGKCISEVLRAGITDYIEARQDCFIYCDTSFFIGFGKTSPDRMHVSNINRHVWGISFQESHLKNSLDSENYAAKWLWGIVVFLEDLV